jgi:hypothetical protein
MFDSLEQQMRNQEHNVSTQARLLRYGLYLLAALLVMGGLTYVVHLIG